MSLTAAAANTAAQVPNSNPPGIDVTPSPDVTNDVTNGAQSTDDAKSKGVDMSQAGAVVNSSGDIGGLGVGAAPASPSIDFNLKMESARKAWENMPQSSVASGNHQPSKCNIRIKLVGLEKLPEKCTNISEETLKCWSRQPPSIKYPSLNYAPAYIYLCPAIISRLATTTTILF